MVVVDAILCLMLIPILSIKGAALSSLVTNGLGVLFSAIRLRKIFGNVWTKTLSKLLIANIIIFLVVSLVGKYWISCNFTVVLLVCVFIYVFFVLGLIVTKCLPIKELIAFFRKRK